jgi:2-oxoglutarate dehydrogenase E2 component (dihydrolipoamide succinyltransferase)
MTIEIKVPNLPESIADATLINWHKKIGDPIAKGENLIDLETDKVVLEVPAPESGHLTHLFKDNGATVTSGEVLATFEIITPTAAVTQPTNQRPKDSDLSPATRRIVHEKQLDVSPIKGSGKHGHITKQDIQNHLSQNEHNAKTNTPEAEALQNHGALTHNEETRPQKRVAMSRLRARISERLLQTQQQSASLTTFNEINMASVIAIRNEYKMPFHTQYGVKLGFMSFFIKAATEALKEHPIINASVDKNDIIYHGFYDVGVAISSPRGLIVPVLRDTDQLNFAQIEKAIATFAQQATDGSLAYDDLVGGTFTITNGGTFGSQLSTPLLNPPQSAILGMHVIQDKAVVEQGEIVIRPMMNLALTYNHCLIDGRDAVLFLKTIINNLESPEKLLLNL